MPYSQRVRQRDACSTHLFKRKEEVAKLLAVHSAFERPLQDVRRQPLLRRHPRTIKGLQLGQALRRQPHSLLVVFERPRRQLALQLVLLLATEVADRGGLIRIALHPLIRELAEEDINGGILSAHADQWKKQQ